MAETVKEMHSSSVAIPDGKNCLECVFCDRLCYCDDSSGNVYCLSKGKRIGKFISMQVHSCAESQNK
jgi:hypothetical protein